MDWYSNILEIIDMRSFTSVWYWIMLAVLWSTTAHWTLGVPYDVVTRARRARGGIAQQDLETLVRVNCNRITHIMDVSGVWIVSLAFFVLTALAILGFWYGVEFGQAVFLVAAPWSMVAAMSVRHARSIRARAEEGEVLRRHLGRLRFYNQVIGLVSIFVTAFWGMWFNLSATVL